MGRLLRWAGYALGVLLLLALLAAGYFWVVSSRELRAHADAKPERLATPTAAQLAGTLARERKRFKALADASGYVPQAS